MNQIAWVCLLIAGLLEIVWVIAMKYSDGFSKLWPSVVTFGAMWLSFSFLSYALKTLPLGMSYAIWVGVGAVGVAIVSFTWFKEAMTLGQVICIALIIIGIAGLKLMSKS
jgi:quaternary ammonium compound-resistance protein SugE